MNSAATLQAAADQVLAASTIRDLIADGDKSAERSFLRILHPDRYTTASDRDRATAAFSRFQELLNGTYTTTTISTRRHTYALGAVKYQGTVANIYEATADGQRFLIKLPRSPQDNDLMAREAESQKVLTEVKDERRDFLSDFVEIFKYRDSAGVTRTGLAYLVNDGYVSLAEVFAQYPQGLDARDLAWIWRRALAVLSYISERDLVHGCLTPEHILIEPHQHLIKVVGWSASVKSGQTISLLGADRKFFPPEVFAKQPASTATDIFTLSTTMDYLLRADAPPQWRTFIAGCTYERPGVRPQDPRALLAELNELLARLYGPRKFRVFPPLTERK